jgi:hypothetical protein
MALFINSQDNFKIKNTPAHHGMRFVFKRILPSIFYLLVIIATPNLCVPQIKKRRQITTLNGIKPQDKLNAFFLPKNKAYLRDKPLV